ncbi:MAG: ABC transporter ATP-binding protein, partial [Gemmatimonadetes bacterium]|nr:ABC transporter ATP-binding protein [Gemmatimonadota bacterium]
MTVLDVRDLEKSFVSPEGERSMIIDVPAFSVQPGEQVGLRGPSG